MITFTIVSLNKALEDRLKSLFGQLHIKYRISRNGEFKEDDDPSIVLIDIDSVKNKEFIEKVKSHPLAINTYLITKDMEAGALDFPKSKVIDSFMTTENVLQLVMTNMSAYTDFVVKSKAPAKIPKEEAIKEVSTQNLPTKELIVEDEEDEDDFVIPPPKQKATIEKEAVVNEDEDDFDDFEDRTDLKKFENTRIVRAPEVKTKAPLETFYVSNQRDDRDIGQQEYLNKLNLKSKLANPVVLGRPMEPIPLKYSPPPDKILMAYRIRQLQKRGMERLQISNMLLGTIREEGELREGALKKRELKRQQYIRLMENGQEDKVPQDFSAGGKSEPLMIQSNEDLRSDLGIPPPPPPKPVQYLPVDENKSTPQGLKTLGFAEESPNPSTVKHPSNPPSEASGVATDLLSKSVNPEQTPPKTNHSRPLFIDDDKEDSFSKPTVAQRTNGVELKTEERTIPSTKRIILEESGDDVLDLFRKKQAERKQLVSEPSITELNLPKTALINSDPMAKIYAKDNIKRAESKTDMRRNTRPPIEKESPDDAANNGGGKKSFFVFGKKK